mgnify:CR=1 FL=1
MANGVKTLAIGSSIGERVNRKCKRRNKKKKREFKFKNKVVYSKIKYEAYLQNPKSISVTLCEILGINTTKQTELILNSVRTELLKKEVIYPVDEISESNLNKLRKLLDKFNY